MCDKKDERFFRPWDVAESIEQEARFNAQEDKSDRVRLPIIKQEDESSGSSCTSTNDETSAISLVENEVSSLRSARRRLRRRRTSSIEATSRSSSVNSEDPPRNSSPDLPNPLVPESSSGSAFSVSQFDHNISSVPGPFPVVNGYPLYSSTYPVDVFQRLSLPHTSRLEPLCGTSSGMIVEASGLQASTVSTTGQPFYCGIPISHHLPHGLYAPVVEQAVEMLHRQDAAAKHLKKLRPKKFRCQHCNVAFSNNGQLKGHIRIHTGERPFKCDAEGCGKSFTRNEELTRHKRIHTGLRPHPCIICGKRFGRKDHLKKHMRTHENRDPYRMSAAALGMLALGHALPQGNPFSAYGYPM